MIPDGYKLPTKLITVKKMKELLEEIPENYMLIPNKVGNLAIMRTSEQSFWMCELSDCNGRGHKELEYVGHIDFLSDEVELND